MQEIFNHITAWCLKGAMTKSTCFMSGVEHSRSEFTTWAHSSCDAFLDHLTAKYLTITSFRSYQTRSRSSAIVRQLIGESSWPSFLHITAISRPLSSLSSWRQHSATFRIAPGNHLPPGQGSPRKFVSSLLSMQEGRSWNLRPSSFRTISQ